MILDLDDDAALDIDRAGAKAAWLARARRAGLPALDGVVLEAEASRPFLSAGTAALTRRGSGGARLEVSGSALPPSLVEALREAGARLGEPMVVRSSGVLEGAGDWAGAFASYPQVGSDELERAVLGCWASAFNVATLARFETAGLRPADHPLAVLVQPEVRPEAGGTARAGPEGVVIEVVEGSPAPLLQGWSVGRRAVVAADGSISGEEAVALAGRETLARVAEVARSAAALGAPVCEWAVAAGQVWLLQLSPGPSSRPGTAPGLPAAQIVPRRAGGGIGDPLAGDIARLARRHPGPLGEALVLSWAVGAPGMFLADVDPVDVDPAEAWRRARATAADLAADVWSAPPREAMRSAAEALRGLRGDDPGATLDRIRSLRPPDVEQGELVRRLLATVAFALATRGEVPRPELAWHLSPTRVGRVLTGGAVPAPRDRIGFDRWEPFQAAVVMQRGRAAHGVAAAPGLGAGRLCYVGSDEDAKSFRPRDVVVAVHPVPNLAPLLWDAAAVVSVAGSPAAHLFESARALAIPAVCSVDLEALLGEPLVGATGRHILAVDGDLATVHIDEW